MKPSSRPRTSSRISDSLHRQLNMYALAASAAGVGALALAQPSEAKIIYTKTDVVIRKNGCFGLDLNHDKIIDFFICNSQTTGGNGSVVNGLFAWPNQTQGDGIEGTAHQNGFYIYQVALRRGARVGYGPRFYMKGVMVAQCIHGTFDSAPVCANRSYNVLGDWINVTNRYLGLDFRVRGKYHYGWARLTVSVARSGIVATLTGYAYETIPNKPIITGKTKGPDVITVQPASLIWRQEHPRFRRGDRESSNALV